MRNFSIHVHNTMVWHIDAIIHAISYHTCIFICKKPAKTKATQARNIPAHILLSGVGLLKRGYNTPSNSGMRRMMKRAFSACIWSGLIVPRKPVTVWIRKCFIIRTLTLITIIFIYSWWRVNIEIKGREMRFHSLILSRQPGSLRASSLVRIRRTFWRQSRYLSRKKSLFLAEWQLFSPNSQAKNQEEA